jgi:hypothetical protein
VCRAARVAARFAAAAAALASIVSGSRVFGVIPKSASTSDADPKDALLRPFGQGPRLRVLEQDGAKVVSIEKFKAGRRAGSRWYRGGASGLPLPARVRHSRTTVGQPGETSGL